MQAQPTTVVDRDVELIRDLILKAVNLQADEAFAIGGDGIILARSKSGKLWIGSGGFSGWVRWWCKGDPYEKLAEACRAGRRDRA